MDERLKEWDYAEDMLRKANEELCAVAEDTILMVIPFNEDNRFVFTEDGGMHEDDMPTIWKCGYPNDTPCKLRGFEIYTNRIEVLLGEDEREESSCRLIDIVATSYEEIKLTIDDWLEQSEK